VSALDGISVRSRVALLVAAVIMFTFFAVQSCIVFGICKNSYELAVFGYSCVISVYATLFHGGYGILTKLNKLHQMTLKRKIIYLEHAAKIIRHDMHSGINTYLPRGVKSLRRRLDEDKIKELGIGAPLQLVEDGLHHAQKVYAGVYEVYKSCKTKFTTNKNHL